MKKYKVNGYVLSEKSHKPLSGLNIEIWDKENVIDDKMGDAVSDEKGFFSISFTEENEKDNIEEGHLIIYFKIYKDEKLLFDTYNKIFWNVEIETKEIIIPVPLEAEEKKEDDTNLPKYKVYGQVTTDKNTSAQNVKASAYSKSIQESKLIGEALTNKEGQYSISFCSANLDSDGKPDIQVKIYNTGKSGKEIGSSDVFYNTTGDVKIDVTVESEKVVRPAEIDRLNNTISEFLKNKSLKDLEVNEHTDDITYLANKTGWDARIIAMAAQAEILSDKTGVSSQVYYVLFRSGLASNEDAINKLPSNTIEDAINNAVEEKIINEINIEKDLRLIKKNAVEFLLSDSYKSGVSSMSAMLDLSLNNSQKKEFAELVHESGPKGEKLWSALEEKGFSKKVIGKLQLDGKLGFLTLQNAPLVKKLYSTHKISEPSQLADAGLYSPLEWKKLIGDDVPPDINVEEYAQVMAYKVKESYPTYVLADIVKKKDLVKGEKGHVNEVYTFLRKSKLEDTIGVKPVKKWDGYEKLQPESQALVKKVERLYQLSPSDEAMKALSKINLTSAFEITKLTRDEFKAKHGEEFSNPDEVDKIYTKAHQIYSTVINVATSYITSRKSPNVYAITGKSERINNA